MKFCENCKEKMANVKLTEVVDGQKTKLFLCEDCAKKRGVTISQSPQEKVVSKVPKLSLASLGPIKKEKDLSCTHCGMTYEIFQNKSLLGCPKDYTVFEERIKGLLEKVHGSYQHKGKIPSKVAPDIAVERQILRLREKLNRAIKKEEYEKAAQIRDQLIKLEEDGHES